MGMDVVCMVIECNGGIFIFFLELGKGSEIIMILLFFMIILCVMMFEFE